SYDYARFIESFFFFFNPTATTEIYTLSLHDALPILAFTTKGLNPFFVNEKDIAKIIQNANEILPHAAGVTEVYFFGSGCTSPDRSEEHTSELQSRENLVCRLLLEKKNINKYNTSAT